MADFATSLNYKVMVIFAAKTGYAAEIVASLALDALWLMLIFVEMRDFEYVTGSSSSESLYALLPAFELFFY